MKKILVLLLATLSCTVSVSAKQKSHTHGAARPFLIVPGYSVGKIVLGMKRATVHQKMGLPSEVLVKAGTGLDTWERKGIDKKNNRKYSAGTFIVSFTDDKVSNISIFYLSGYATLEGLAVFDSTFEQFEKRFGKAIKDEYNLDPESPTGISTAMQSVWGYPRQGLTITSAIYVGGEEPTSVVEVDIYEPQEPTSLKSP